LARLLGESGVTVAFRSQTERAKQTLKPLENRLGAALVVKEVGIGVLLMPKTMPTRS
jgi:hypothetical protein